ncbi:hypothetical protein KSP40_PGU007491 [Platanthera guangdongensis]|uniref:RIN4 pathogenic type III effector avirulence factor Avr cleavage site domain-containing protein n=1 Tax=Platanthera guangdongensis TaxID=2320717 RepID=A0ABR2LI62_9ASPA
MLVNQRISVPAFGEWDGKVGLPDYSIDFSKIRENRRQNKSRVSLGNEDELNHISTNDQRTDESIKNNDQLHQLDANAKVVSPVLHIATCKILEIGCF